MIKSILACLFLTIVQLAGAQKLKDKLQGDWVCIGISTLNGLPATGKFGAPSEYLKIQF